MPARLLALTIPVVLASLLTCGCIGKKLSVPPLVENATVTDSGEPSHITVQHILIGFQGTVQGKHITRTRDDAKLLAVDLLMRAKSGEDFDDLVEEYTDDSPPGIYHMANFGQRSEMTSDDPNENVFPRNGMVPAFGDVGFPLEAGEISMSDYDAQTSPFGWHIIKRLR